MYTIPFLQHDCFWRLLPTMCDCNLVCVLITKHYTVSRWNRLQAKITHLPKLQQVLCHKLCELWQGLLFSSCRVWRSLFENLHNSNHFVFFFLLSLWAFASPLSVIVWESVPGAKSCCQPIWLKLGTGVGSNEVFQEPIWLTSLTFSFGVSGGVCHVLLLKHQKSSLPGDILKVP